MKENRSPKLCGAIAREANKADSVQYPTAVDYMTQQKDVKTGNPSSYAANPTKKCFLGCLTLLSIKKYQSSNPGPVTTEQ